MRVPEQVPPLVDEIAAPLRRAHLEEVVAVPDFAAERPAYERVGAHPVAVPDGRVVRDGDAVLALRRGVPVVRGAVEALRDVRLNVGRASRGGERQQDDGDDGWNPHAATLTGPRPGSQRRRS